MGDGPSIQNELHRLREEIFGFRNLPTLSAEFAAWLGQLTALVINRFGINSIEMRQLRAISPELPSEFYDSVAERLGSLGLNAALQDRLLTKLHRDAPTEVFKRRLSEYDEFIAAVLQGLRSGIRS